MPSQFPFPLFSASICTPFGAYFPPLIPYYHSTSRFFPSPRKTGRGKNFGVSGLITTIIPLHFSSLFILPFDLRDLYTLLSSHNTLSHYIPHPPTLPLNSTLQYRLPPPLLSFNPPFPTSMPLPPTFIPHQ